VIHKLICICLLAYSQIGEQSLPPEASALVQTALDDENRRDFDAAIVALRKAAELAPDSAVISFHLGDAYMKKGAYAEAIPPLKHAAEANPDSLPVHQLLGFALLSQGYAREAIAHLELVHEYGALGIAQLQNNQASEAVSNLQLALAKNPNDPDLLYYLSRASNALASQSLDKLLVAFPNSARSHQALAQNYFAMKMFPDSIKEYERSVALRPDLPGLRLELGQAYAANSRWEQAELQFRAETKLQPGNAEAAYHLGNSLLQEGKMKEAAQELQRSDSLAPDMPETLYALGRSLTVSDASRAERAFARVVELETASPLAAQAYLALAGIHRKQGNGRQAADDMQHYKQIQSANPVRESTSNP
jgi:tetratricopeptide (TPR) repeat protein